MAINYHYKSEARARKTLAEQDKKSGGVLVVKGGKNAKV
jgi:hypothetical protein